MGIATKIAEIVEGKRSNGDATKGPAKKKATRAATIRVHDDQILSGHSLLFRSYEAALRASRRVTGKPGVTEYWSPGRDSPWYAADGDYWIGNNGERGQYLYGKGGRLIHVIEVE